MPGMAVFPLLVESGKTLLSMQAQATLERFDQRRSQLVPIDKTTSLPPY